MLGSIRLKCFIRKQKSPTGRNGLQEFTMEMLIATHVEAHWFENLNKSSEYLISFRCLLIWFDIYMFSGGNDARKNL